MHKRITFRHMEHSKVMEDYINQQLEKILNFLSTEREPIYLDLVFTDGKLHAHHEMEMIVKTPHYEAFVKHEGPEPYKVVDKVLDTMYEKLRVEKRKFVESQRTIDKY